MQRALLAVFVLLAAAYRVQWIPLGCTCKISHEKLEVNPGDARSAGGKLLVYVVDCSSPMENFTFDSS